MPENKFFAFRFDVDTHKCLRDGVPNLIRLGELTGAHFTFFVLMGRAVSRAHFLKRCITPKFNPRPDDRVEMMSALTKLGALDYIRVATLNPKVGENYDPIVRLLHETGHEVGIHGGRNHELWHFGAHAWSRSKLEDEIQYSLDLAHRSGIRPKGFSSPGWSTAKHLEEVLRQAGYCYVADDHGLDQNKAVVSPSGLIRVPTNILGEPGGVGYLENCRVRGLDDEGLIQDFKSRLLKAGDLAVAYDHPYYAGTKELHILPRLLGAARDLGFQVTTLENIAERAS